MESRREERRAERFQVLLSNEKSLMEAYSATENVSSNGARVRTSQAWKAGASVFFKSSLGELWGHARVVYCQPLPANDFVVGLCFFVRTGAWIAQM
jgi:hypothetical protein